MTRTVLTLVAMAAGRFAAAQEAPAAAHPAGRAECYRTDRALGTSAGSAEGRGVPGPVGRYIGEDSASLWRLTTFRLLPGGRADRPAASGPDSWARASRWERARDTLRVTLSTGTSGWALTFVTTSPGDDSTYAGVARYLTDVIVRDWQPPRVAVGVTREACAPPA